MQHKSTEPEILEIILKEVERISFKKVGEKDSLLKTQVLDSIAVVDLIVTLQDSLGVTINLAEINLENFDTVELMGHIVMTKLHKEI